MKMFLLALVLVSTPLSALAQATPFAPFTQEPFADVSTSHPSYEAIESLRKINILRGYPDGTFQPDSRINRAEFVYLITHPVLLDTQRMNDCLKQADAESVALYPDVNPDAWYAAAVCHATQKEIIDGFPDGRFHATRSVNFVQAAKMLSNIFALQTQEEPTEKWFEPYVRKLSSSNAIPRSIETYGQTITRAEMAEMLYRMKNNIQDRPARSASELSY